jgi:hypothetical protein
VLNGSSADAAFPRPRPFTSSLYMLNEIYFKNIFSNLLNRKWSGESFGRGELLELIRKEIKVGDNPSFNYIHYFADTPGHADPTSASAEALNAYSESFRKSRLKHANDILLETIKLIIAKDKEALVVLMGDHGTWRFGKTVYSEKDNDRLVLDKFGALLAVRWPISYDGRYDQDIKTSVNLFRFITAFLATDDEILKSKEKDESFFLYKGSVYKAVEAGEMIKAVFFKKH